MKWSSATAALSAVITAAATLMRIRPNSLPVIRLHDLLEWFTERADRKAEDPDNIAFTLLQRPAPAGLRLAKPPTRAGERSRSKVVLLLGLFNTRTETPIDCRTIHADRMDDDVAEAHRATAIVLYR